jgi:hypothetical protein
MDTLLQLVDRYNSNVDTDMKDNAIFLWKQDSANPDDVSTKIIHHNCWIISLLAFDDGTR